MGPCSGTITAPQYGPDGSWGDLTLGAGLSFDVSLNEASGRALAALVSTQDKAACPAAPR
ncbi:MAG TPA: hypothetical protein VEJ84_08450 [Acidimicrobiales bacterium]|nr:hypothetical protein [Acidimicrobiales bacterium]